MSNKDKRRPIFGLKKIPIKELLKHSRIEVGQLKAYVDELEDANKKLRKEIEELTKLSSSERKKIKEKLAIDKIYAQQRSEIEELTVKVKKLKKENDINLMNKRQCQSLTRNTDMLSRTSIEVLSMLFGHGV